MIVFRNVYFDNNATTPIDPTVLKETSRFLKNFYGNPSSIHALGLRSRDQLDQSRTAIAKLLHCSPQEIFFTSGGSESNNLAIKGFIEHHSTKERNQIITTKIEHSSVLDCCRALQKKGFEVTFLPVDRDGRVDLESFRQSLTEKTLLVSVMMANNETGTIQDISLLSEMTRKSGAAFHCDCVQSFGKMEIDLRKLAAVDLASFSSHKIFGPKGTGALFVRNGITLSPQINGGHQEGGIRGGTENLPGIFGFVKAAELVLSDLKATETKYLKLKNRLYHGLTQIRKGIQVNGPFTGSLPNTLNLYLPGIDSRDLLGYLSLHGIYTSTGSACSESHTPYSHVITDLGHSPERAAQSLRISFGRQNSLQEIDYFIKAFKNYCRDGNRIITILPKQAIEMIRSGEVPVLDVRLGIERKMFRGIEGARECSLFGIGSQCSDLPRDKSILIYCQSGFNVFVAAWIMKARKFKKIFVLGSGLSGLRLYQKLNQMEDYGI